MPIVHAPIENQQLQWISEPTLHQWSSTVPHYQHKCIEIWFSIHFFSDVRSWVLWNASDFICMHLSRPAWRCRGRQRAQQHWRAVPRSQSTQKQPLLHSTCYLWESACCLPPPACPQVLGSTKITFCFRSAHTRLSMKLGEWIPCREWG